MFYWRTMNNKIICIHGRALKLVDSDHVSLFDELLEKDWSFSIHHRKIQSLAIELYKFIHGLSPSIIWKMSPILTQMFHTTLSHSKIYGRDPKTVKYGIGTISYLAPKIWSLVPNAIKGGRSLDVFKSKMRQWEPDFLC